MSRRQRTSADNPLVEGLERLPVHPTTLVIFGATGDLARRKLLPALYNLAHEGALPERFNLVGVLALGAWPTTSSARMAREADPRVLAPRARRDGARRAARRASATSPGSFDDAVGLRRRSSETLDEFDEDAGQPLNRCFYLSTAPEFFPVIVEAARRAQARPPRGRRRPGRHREAVRDDARRGRGSSTASVLSVFDERQVFRIDHYLGKETVQNIMAFRFANGAVRADVEPQLHRPRPDHRRRGHRRSARAPATTTAPARCATSSRTTCSSCCAAGDGAAGALHGRRGPRREGQGPARDPRADAGARRRDRGPRAVRRRATVGGEDVGGLPRGGRRARPTPTPRPTPRCAWRSTTGAGPASRSTCAPASGWRAR